jgi:hypothetical protein
MMLAFSPRRKEAGFKSLRETRATALAPKNEARRRTVREQSALGVGNAPFLLQFDRVL